MIIIYGSSRDFGNTEYFVENALQNIVVERVYLREHNIKNIIDQRHDELGFSFVDDDFHEIATKLLEHNKIVFATPIYWYSMSGIMKNFIDRWSHAMRDDRYGNFRERLNNKKAYVIAVGGDNPKVKGLPMIQQFQYIFDFMGMNFDGYVIGKASKRGEIELDVTAKNKLQNLRLKWEESI